MYIIRIQKVTK